MPKKPETPQLPLNFDSDLPPLPHSEVRQGNVLSFFGRTLRGHPPVAERINEHVDSVLEELLTEAKRLKW